MKVTINVEEGKVSVEVDDQKMVISKSETMVKEKPEEPFEQKPKTGYTKKPFTRETYMQTIGKPIRRIVAQKVKERGWLEKYPLQKEKNPRNRLRPSYAEIRKLQEEIVKENPKLQESNQKKLFASIRVATSKAICHPEYFSLKRAKKKTNAGDFYKEAFDGKSLHDVVKEEVEALNTETVSLNYKRLSRVLASNIMDKYPKVRDNFGFREFAGKVEPNLSIKLKSLVNERRGNTPIPAKTSTRRDTEEVEKSRKRYAEIFGGKSLSEIAREKLKSVNKEVETSRALKIVAGKIIQEYPEIKEVTNHKRLCKLISPSVYVERKNS